MPMETQNKTDLESGQLQAKVYSLLDQVPAGHPDWIKLKTMLEKHKLFSPPQVSRFDINRDGRIAWWEKLLMYAALAASAIASILGAVLGG